MEKYKGKHLFQTEIIKIQQFCSMELLLLYSQLHRNWCKRCSSGSQISYSESDSTVQRLQLTVISVCYSAWLTIISHYLSSLQIMLNTTYSLCILKTIWNCPSSHFVCTGRYILHFLKTDEAILIFYSFFEECIKLFHRTPFITLWGLFLQLPAYPTLISRPKNGKKSGMLRVWSLSGHVQFLLSSELLSLWRKSFRALRGGSYHYTIFINSDS